MLLLRWTVVAVLGGALLGDRIRMQSHSSDENVFIRSMAARGHLGGLAAAGPGPASSRRRRIRHRRGGTVGVGQSEVEVAAAANTTIVMLAQEWERNPGS